MARATIHLVANHSSPESARLATESTNNDDCSDTNASITHYAEIENDENNVNDTVNESACDYSNHESGAVVEQQSELQNCDTSVNADVIEAAFGSTTAAVKSKTRKKKFPAKNKKNEKSEPVNIAEGFHIK